MLSAGCLVLTLIASASPAAAQAQASSRQETAAADPVPVTFLPRTAFHMSAAHLADDDPRFIWDANFGGELDLIEYGRGRVTFVANYQVVLGDELRIFDPNQGNYILAGSTSARVAGLEVAAVFHHESRHLSDRVKVDPVDWNMLGGRVRKTATAGPVAFDARADLRRVIQRSFVDYEWELDADLRNVYRVAPAFALVSDVDLRLLGVDGSQNRGRQAGYRLEGGVRLEGAAGAIELFVAAERVIDPYPLEFGTKTWVATGFRLLSR